MMLYAVEIRSYQLKAGTREAFHAVVVNEAIPLLQRWENDFVAYGPSLHDETSYYVIRAYASLEARQANQDAFYSSEDWRQGPRERILAPIETYTDVVLMLDKTAIEALRESLA